jgi:hypothetical protein
MIRKLLEVLKWHREVLLWPLGAFALVVAAISGVVWLQDGRPLLDDPGIIVGILLGGLKPLMILAIVAVADNHLFNDLSKEEYLAANTTTKLLDLCKTGFLLWLVAHYWV